MKAPQFWNYRNWQSSLLYPLGCIYAGITALRLKLTSPYRSTIPVICIGNLSAGGSGKTPTALSIARILQQSGRKPFFISRGYGGKLQNVVVNPQTHSPYDVGDEPLLLAAQAPVIVNHHRDHAARLAESQGADTIIMDDGFQNPSLHKDKSLLVIDGAVGLGNQYPIPAGPLREFFACGIKRADALIILGDDTCNIAAQAPELPIFRGKVVPQIPTFNHAKILAFAGIGRPQKFFQSLIDCGADLCKTFSFPDHHFYSETELNQIITEAENLQAAIFTTAKDAVKIPFALREKFNVLNIDIVWENEKSLKDFLLS